MRPNEVKTTLVDNSSVLYKNHNISRNSDFSVEELTQIHYGGHDNNELVHHEPYVHTVCSITTTDLLNLV